MSYPDPKTSPIEFLEHLKTLNLDSAIGAFRHNQIQPPPLPNGQLNEAKVHEWCDRMDSLLVRHSISFHLSPSYANYLQSKLNRTMGSQPAHKDICGALHKICTDTIIDLEGRLETQKQSDAAEAAWVLEAKKAKEAARLATEEKIRKMQQELLEMRTVQFELEGDPTEEPQQQKTAGVNDEEDEDEDEEDEEMNSGSAGEEPQVSLLLHIYISFYTDSYSQPC
jgi:hypothetical protein